MATRQRIVGPESRPASVGQGEERPTLEALAQRLGLSQPHGRRPTNPDDDFEALLSMSLDRFAREGQFLEIRVPWLGVTLWFVPEEWDAEALSRDGIRRGRVWTARELMLMMTVTDLKAVLPSIGLAKLSFDGDITEAIQLPDGSVRAASERLD